MKEKEHYSTRLVRRNALYRDALKAVIDYHKALDYYQFAPFKGDAGKDVDEKKKKWEEKLGEIRPHLEEDDA